MMLARPSLFVVGGLWAIGVDFSHYMARWCGVNPGPEGAFKLNATPVLRFLPTTHGSMPFFSHLGGSSSILGTSSETPGSLAPHPIFGSCCEVCKRSSTNCRCSLGSCEHIVTLTCRVDVIIWIFSVACIISNATHQSPQCCCDN